MKNCPEQMATLEKALYKTGRNQYELNRIFFPPRQLSSRYIKVNYKFLNNDTSEENNTDCTVQYVWATGGFFLIQPPAVFEFTSLLFSYPANSLEFLNLTLPYECRPLVMNSCSCSGRDNNELDILTQHVSCTYNSILYIGACHKKCIKSLPELSSLYQLFPPL